MAVLDWALVICFILSMHNLNLDPWTVMYDDLLDDNTKYLIQTSETTTLHSHNLQSIDTNQSGSGYSW